ncbi:hypothetical protein CHS0354_017226 [Potamilus streckersoni]|uniref:Uncharacterized protein n=1 Tax=Potamilus streckersoni TaxID=2493646 RepID=A0AAE0SIL7_9BIVA|nr:hypothetical protein CHS0354_017226 [Potamilus streckersoni]
MASVNEDYLASDEVLPSLDVRTNEGLSCPLCLNLFRSPRQLPCMHSFCEACLQSHISKTVPERLLCGELHCPVCESKVSLPAEYSVEKSKVDGEIKCDTCKSENIVIQAEGYCFDCNEARCTDCLQSHRKEKILKVHNVIRIDAFNTKPEFLNTFGSDFRCDVHANESLTHKCKNYKVLLCSTCREIDHKVCATVTKLDKETPISLTYQQLHQIQQEIKKCDDEVTNLLAIIQTNLNSLKTQAREIIDQIKDFRKRINDVFDDLEKTLQQHAERIYKEELLKMKEKKRNCQSLKVAMKNTNLLYKFLNRHGTDVQKHILAEKVKHHTCLLQKKIDSTRAQNKAPTFHLEINP